MCHRHTRVYVSPQGTLVIFDIYDEKNELFNSGKVLPKSVYLHYFESVSSHLLYKAEAEDVLKCNTIGVY